MSPTSFRKTILALAISAALPVSAQSLVLDNTGIEENDATYSDVVEITGSFTSSNSDVDAIEFNSTVFENDLILNATINANGDNASGLDLSLSGDDEDNLSTVITEIKGSLTNKGSISVVGRGTSGMLIDPAIIRGDFINEGTISVKGEPLDNEAVRAMELWGTATTIHGDLINKATGKILAEGTNATGILLEGAEIKGSLVNNGLIQVAGENSLAITSWPSRYGRDPIFGPGPLPDGSLNDSTLGSVTPPNTAQSSALSESWFEELPRINSIINSGTIIANGIEAKAIAISGYDTNRIINSGLIHADGTAIHLTGVTSILYAGVTPVGEPGNSALLPGAPYDDLPTTPLTILNTGNIHGGISAIDASAALNYDSGTGIEMLWNAGTITGNIRGMHEVAIEGPVIFDGQLLESRFIDIGWTEDNAIGHLELKKAHTTLDTDNLQVGQGSSLGLTLSSATNANQALVTVTGAAIFEANSQIKLAAKGSDFSVEGQTYTLVQAGSLTDQGLSVVSSSALLNVDSFNVDGTTIRSTVTGKGADEVATDIAGSGASGNAQAAIKSFSPLMAALGTTNPNDPVFLAFANANEEQLARLAEQLAPEVNGGSTSAAISGQSLISNVTGSRTSSVRGQSSGEHFKEAGVWVQALYSDADQNQRDGVAGYNAYSRGMAVGADGKVNDQLTLGLAYSFLDTKVNGNTGNRTDVEGHAFTLYGGFESGNAFVDGSLTYGLNDNSGKRQIAGTTAKGAYDSELLGLNLVGGYTYRIDNNLLIEPRVAARYSNVQIDSYREKGSSAALNVEDQRYEVFELGAGVRVAGSYPLGQGTLEPQVKLMAYHDFAADQASSTSTFVLGNTPFVTQGAKPVRNSYEAGVGVDYRLGAVTVGASYDHVGKSGFNADTFLAKVRYDF